MNKPRLKKIQDIAKEIEKLAENIEALTGDLDDLLSEEQDYYDNMPENLQYSYQGERSEEAIDIMNDAIESLEEITHEIGSEIENVYSVIDDLDSIY